MLLHKRTSRVVQVALCNGIRARDGFVRPSITKEKDEIMDCCSVVHFVFREEVLSGKVQTTRRVGPAFPVLAFQTFQFGLHLQAKNAEH